MIKFQNNLFYINNGVFEYVVGIGEDKKLYHASFLPIEVAKEIDYKGQRNRFTKPYPFEVLVNVNFEPLQCSHGVRYFWSLSSFRAEYDSYKTEKISDGERLTITLLDKQVNMYIHLIYEIFDNSPALRRYTSVENISNEDIVVNHISSFMLSNFPYFNSLQDKDDLYLHQFKSQWSWEGEHQIDSFSDLGVYRKWCRNGYAIENTSTAVCQSNIPYFVIEERNSKLFWAVELEYSSSWRFEIGAGEVECENWFYIQGGMENDLHAQWFKTLKPNEVFISPSCSIVTANGCIEDIYNAMHKHQSNVLIKHSKLDEKLPVIYNDWQYMYGMVTEEKVIEQLDKLKESGVECYVIDAGWFTETDTNSQRSNWWDMVGDWDYDKTRFPNGLAFVAEEIEKRGLIPGIWCEIEAVGQLSKLYNNENLLLRRGNRFVEDARRRFLYFGSEEGRDYATSVFDRLIGYGFKYFKIDYNADSAPGCTNSNDSLGQGLHENREGYYQWLDQLRSRFPDIIIENCSSGGMRLEYGMLSHTDLASITDQISNQYTGSILFNVSKLIHPSQCGNWSALKDEFDLDEYAFTLTNSMMGRMHISGDIVHQSLEKQQLLISAINFYKNIRGILKNPTVYYHTADFKYHDDNQMLAYEYCICEKTMSVLLTTRLNSAQDFLNIKITSLKEGVYEVSSFPNREIFEISSTGLKEKGLQIQLKNKYTSQIILLKRID